MGNEDGVISRNYNSVFFENEITKEQYNREINTAVKVKQISEINFKHPLSQK